VSLAANTGRSRLYWRTKRRLPAMPEDIACLEAIDAERPSDSNWRAT